MRKFEYSLATSPTMEDTIRGFQAAYPVVEIDPGNQIRVLKILPAGDGSNHISCELFALDLSGIQPSQDFRSFLDTSPCYDALSYAWGANDGDKTTISLNHGEGHVEVTRNLWMALFRLRLRKWQGGLWIDQICINQSDTHERNLQVRLMDKVYANAGRVIVWLGDDLDEVEKLSRLPNLILPSSQSSHLRWYWDVSCSGEDELRPSMEACEHPATCLHSIVTSHATTCWWERIWIIQEVALARVSPVVMFAQHECTWEWLLSVQGSYYQQTVADAARAFRRGAAYKALWENSSSLINILRRTTSTDPRDKIYGLLSLASTAIRDLITPDYEKTVTHVFAEATYAIMASNSAFDLMIFHRRPRSFGSPSWICDFEKTILSHLKEDVEWQRKSGSFQNQLQKVTNHRPLPTTLNIRYEPGSQALLVKGRMLDRIDVASGWSLSTTYLEMPCESSRPSVNVKTARYSKLAYESRQSPVPYDFPDLQQQLRLIKDRLAHSKSSSASLPGPNVRPATFPTAKIQFDINRWDELGTQWMPRHLNDWLRCVQQDLGSENPFQRLHQDFSKSCNNHDTAKRLKVLLGQALDPFQTVPCVFEEWRKHISTHYALNLPPRESDPKDLDVWLSYLDCESIFVTEAGFLCLAPLDTKPGDQLFLPSGGFAPMLLRRRNGLEEWEFRDFVYVNGIMDRELGVTGLDDRLEEDEVRLI